MVQTLERLSTEKVINDSSVVEQRPQKTLGNLLNLVQMFSFPSSRHVAVTPDLVVVPSASK